jgi:hypothetical protein
MMEGVFALAGAMVGIVGTLLAELARSRIEDRRQRRSALLSACADFSTALAHVRQLCYDRHAAGPSPELTERMRQAHGIARGQYERLRLVTGSIETQEHARLALRYALRLWRHVEGELQRAPDERSPVDLMEDHLKELYVGVRRELEVPNPERVFAEPQEARRLPGEA